VTEGWRRRWSGLLFAQSPHMVTNLNDLAPPAWAAAGILPEQGVRLSEVVSALSYALDITEGQAEGHAVRSCVIGMLGTREYSLAERMFSVSR